MEINTDFCIQGRSNPQCIDLSFHEFPDEKDTISILLDYFKKLLPEILKTKKDYFNQPIIMNPDDIDLIIGKDYGKYVVLLSITDDDSTYSDDTYQFENTEYVFELLLQVIADDLRASLENLIHLKSAVKTLLVNIDDKLNLLTTIEGFSYIDAGSIKDQNAFVRQGIYRFSVQNSNKRK